MHKRTARDRPCHSWQIQRALRELSIWADPKANDRLRRLAARGGIAAWESTGRDASFTLDSEAMSGPLAAGWYELRGELETHGDSMILPSVRICYTQPSILTDFEVLLPEPDASGRIRALLLFLGEVESLQFSPGVDPVRFRMHGFSLRRVSRSRALLAMLGGSQQAFAPAGKHRLFAWLHAVRQHGLKRATDALYAAYRKRSLPDRIDEYGAWIRKYDTLDEADIAKFKQRAATLGGSNAHTISLLLDTDGILERALRRCLDSLLAQVWPHWELCAVVDGSLAPQIGAVLTEYAGRDPRIRIIPHEGARGTSELRAHAPAAARGGFVVLLDSDGVLRPHSLLQFVEAIAADPERAILYCDEDVIDADGVRRDPDFKPDWNPDLLLSHNYLGHLVALRTSLVREAGGILARFVGCGDLEPILRCSERVAPRQIHHIPEILYHGTAGARRECDSATAMRAVAAHLERAGSAAQVEPGKLPGSCRVRWLLPVPPPRISIITPTRDRADLLRRCVESILARSTYPDFELVVVDNRSGDRRALGYLEELAGRARVRVLRRDAPFNFSALNNWAARQCAGQLLALVNNDIEVIAPDWLEEMAGLAMRPDTGAVGAMLYYPDDTIQHAGMLLGINGIAGHVYAGKPRGHSGHCGRARTVQNLSAVTGACLMVRRELYEAVGGLDERLPVEFNDLDFCLRLGELGYRNVWTPFAELYHHESGSRTLEDASAKRMREEGVAYMTGRWREWLRDDPAYNPNLSLQSLDFDLAFPPRVRQSTGASKFHSNDAT